MTNTAIITGGAGGMGLATANLLGKDHHLIICDIKQSSLDTAIESLQKNGVSCESALCDISDSANVSRVFNQAAEKGNVRSVIHTAGLSPQMADPDTIMRVNALGTINVANAAWDIATAGFALVNVASMAAYLVPSVIIPNRAFKLCFSDQKRFLKKSVTLAKLMPKELYRNGMAYGISKQFVIWYSKKSAARFGEKGARILSVSPGTFDTAMGRLEEKSGAMEMLKMAALKRPGKPEEIAEILAFCASEKASYLTGTDVLCDGGVVASKI